MRDIKFRVYNPRDQKIHYDITGIEFYENGKISGVFIDGAFFLKDEVCLMQYTGLKDKNGKEIYDRDILNFDDEYWLVCYDCGKFIGIEDGVCVDLWDISDYEVIGNEYNNPELL